ncbi:flavodoxin [Paracoccus sp. SCSIO 75233]|uniref:flavodoxin n=1 Tax=Paracoccus sp. SCSIO 75233 TaxID=3017782 RepID=UPI0022F00180|nr:flavodoxin [Paracoccus sp. SCSIO 75233]WBU54433.1 flavodoxin [Paracoccus sp. SCSIO 75233]
MTSAPSRSGSELRLWQAITRLFMLIETCWPITPVLQARCPCTPISTLRIAKPMPFDIRRFISAYLKGEMTRPSERGAPRKGALLNRLICGVIEDLIDIYDLNLPLNFHPAVTGALSGYRIIFLGFPIWGIALPDVMAGFLRSQDMTGKTILPFITHGGYGQGSAMDTLRALAPGEDIAPPLVLECDQERSTLRAMNGWLGEVEELP